MKKRVVLYVRVSTDEQAKHGYSLSAQVEALEAYAKSQGWEIIHVYVEDGESAKDLNRTQFKKMMEHIKAGGVDVLLVYRLDRLTRSVLDLYTVLQDLEKHNCAFKSATEVYDTTSAMGKLFITLVAAIAQWERENLAERVKMGVSKKVRSGKFAGGMSAYGYDYTNDELVPNQIEAPNVKEIFEMAKTLSPFNIAKELTKRGVATRKGNVWNRTTISSMLNNPIYAGYIQHSTEKSDYKKPAKYKELYESEHEKLVSQEEFWAMQDILERRRWIGTRQDTNDYIYASLIKCARCGSAYISHKRRNKKGYRCSGQRNGAPCDNRTFNEDSLTKVLQEQFGNFNVLNVNAPARSEAIQTDLDEIKKEIQSIEKQKQKYKNMYKADIIELEETQRETHLLNTRQRELSELLRQYEQPAVVESINHIKANFTELWKHASDTDRKSMVNVVIKQIVVDTERINGRENRIIIKQIK